MRKIANFENVFCLGSYGTYLNDQIIVCGVDGSRNSSGHSLTKPGNLIHILFAVVLSNLLQIVASGLHVKSDYTSFIYKYKTSLKDAWFHKGGKCVVIVLYF